MPKRKRTQHTNVSSHATAAVPIGEAAASNTSPLRQSARVRKTALRVKATIAAVGGEESSLSELEEPEQKPKRRRRKKNDEPVVYDIPPVEHKDTNFRGRLGYACLNTILRITKPDPTFCSRTCRLDTIRKNGVQFAKDLGLQNCKDLLKLIEWNEKNKIRFLRVSSEMFPFASHGVHGYSLDYAATELMDAGDLAKKLGHRLTTHPGQFTQLASPKDDVITASIRELDYHCQMMRHMGLDQDSVIILHMGGVYGDKPGTLDRFRETFRTRLTQEMRDRLVLENDEICYSADDLLPVCEELGIPLVFDYHHNWINPSVLPMPELQERINAIWVRRGIRPKQHLSEPRPGAETVMEKRAHADRCASLPEHLPVDMDLMIEAKDKEQAVLHLYRIYGLHPVIHENLRPEKPPKPFPRRGDTTAEPSLNAAVEVGGDMDAAIAVPPEEEDAMPVEGPAKADAETGEQVEEHDEKPKKRRKRAAKVKKVEEAAVEALETELIMASTNTEDGNAPKDKKKRKNAHKPRMSKGEEKLPN